CRNMACVRSTFARWTGLTMVNLLVKYTEMSSPRDAFSADSFFLYVLGIALLFLFALSLALLVIGGTGQAYPISILTWRVPAPRFNRDRKTRVLGSRCRLNQLCRWIKVNRLFDEYRLHSLSRYCSAQA